MSVLVTVTEVSPREPSRLGAASADGHAGLMRSTLDGTFALQGNAAVHCGTPMQLVTPALSREHASYTFGPADAGGTELPPVWRCACGFQLDAWTTGPGTAYPSVVSPA